MAQLQEEEGQGGSVKRRKVAAAANVTMELDILDCPVCFDPLRPPIFQCAVGHVVCSSCRDKLPAKCHLCSLTTGYNRCYMLEHVIESIKVPCSNDNLGCTAEITYFQKGREKVCPHAPCFCPETGCVFRGSTVMLLDHFSAKHKWPSAKVTYNKSLPIRIQQGLTALCGEDGHLFLLDMVIMEPLGGAISVFCVQPHITKSRFKCRLAFSCTAMGYSQISELQARGTNLYYGLPKDCFQFIVPKILLQGTGTKVTAMVCVMLIPLPPKSITSK